KRWNFPTNLVGVARYNPPRADVPGDLLPLVVIVHGAKYLATSVGAGVAADGFLFELQADLLKEWAITPELLESLLPTVLERADRVLHEQLSTGEIEI